MLFNSVEFICGFLPLAVAAFYLASRRGPEAAIWTLMLASLAYYGFWNPVFLPLLLGSLVVNYALVGQIARRDVASGRPFMAWGVVGNILVLVWFKYSRFIASVVAPELDRSILPDTIPLALSFTTFVQISFLIDSWRARLPAPRVGDYALFVVFFPHLIAGPIVRWSELGPQIAERATYRVNWASMAMGATIFTIGLAKKVLLADSLSEHVAPVFDAAARGDALTMGAAWGGAIAYAMQLYFDFSGYSDMAIGLGLMFNLRLPVNFLSPYRATSIIEFWRRWHISLSRFLRDYLYIPMGGNRRGPARRHVNLFLTMLIGGIWHGAGWTFVIWGALHGAYLAINHLWRAAREAIGLKANAFGVAGKILAWMTTFTAVLVAWAFFRADTPQAALHIVGTMFGVVRPESASGIELAHDRWMIRQGFIAEGWVAALFGSHFSVVAAMITAGLLALALIGPDPSRFVGYRERPDDPLRPLSWPLLGWRPSPIWLIAMVALFLTAMQMMYRTSEFLYWQF